MEKGRVGYWEWSEPATTNYSSAYVRFELDADRYIHFESQPHVIYYEDPSTQQETWTGYYVTDADGTIHGTNTSGAEEYTQHTVDGDGTLGLCDDQGQNCLNLTKRQ
jgi:hypothetical protein